MMLRTVGLGLQHGIKIVNASNTIHYFLHINYFDFLRHLAFEMMRLAQNFIIYTVLVKTQFQDFYPFYVRFYCFYLKLI